MTTKFARFFSVVAAIIMFAAFAEAQTGARFTPASSKYVISANAGTVNLVEGSVGIVRAEGGSGYLLHGEALEVGDRVSSGANGRVEVLLNPGSYLRLGPRSAFEFKTTSLEDLQIQLDSGSAILEVFATEDFTVTVSSPKSQFRLIKSGVYRIDVGSDGVGKIQVTKGSAELGDAKASLVKSGREGVLSNGSARIRKFDRGDTDELDSWSKDRAKELARLIGSLDRNNMRTALMRSFLGRQWDLYGSFGVWVFDPFRRSHCFLPFGWGWGSPYGFGFGYNIYSYNLPAVVFTPPPAGTPPGSPVQTVKPGRLQDAPVRPPFVQVQGSSEATGPSVRSVKQGRGDILDPSYGSDPVRSSSGVFSPPVSSGAGSSPAPPMPPPVLDAKPGRRP